MMWTSTRMIVPAASVMVAAVVVASVPGEVRDDAGRIGLSADRLAVAGFTAAEAQTILGRLAAASAARQSLHNAEESAASAARELTSAASAAKIDPWNQTLAAQVIAARAAVQQATALVEQRRSELSAAALDGFDQSKLSGLQACAAPAASSLPLPLRLAAQDDNTRKVLSGALIAESKSVRLGVAVPSQAAATLAAARALPAVVAGETSLTSSQAAIEAVFDQY